MSNPVANYICSTQSLVDFAVEKLSASNEWKTYKLRGAITNEIFNLIPDMKLPAVVVTVTHTSYANFPRRTSTLAVVVCTDATIPDSEFSARDIVDSIVGILDDEVYEHAHYKVSSCVPVTLDMSVISHLLEFTVKDN